MLLLDNNSQKDGEAYVKKMILTYPSRWEFSRMLVVYYSQTGEYNKAITILEDWIALNQNYTQPDAYKEAKGWLDILKSESQPS